MACVNYSLGTAQGDSNTYLTATTVDPNKHVSVAYTDVLGRTVYTQEKSGLSGGTLTLVQQTASVYNALDKPTSITVTDKAPQSGQTITSVSTTAQYDDLGRLTQVADPDRGTHNYTYDADGRMFVDASGTRTIGYVYDLLGRVGCVQDAYPSFSPTGVCTSGANPYVQNTYDTNKLTVSGTTDYPVGRLTQSVATNHFPDGSTVTASNLVSLSTTQAAVPGASGSGGSETQNFCYDEQNRLVWAGNSGTQPAAGNGTCGSGTLRPNDFLIERGTC